MQPTTFPVLVLTFMLLVKSVFGQFFEGTGEREQGALLDPGNTCMTGVDDRCETIKLACAVPFRSKSFKKIQVCSNGVVCFGKKYTDPLPPLNGQERANLKNIYCLAPYYADLDLSYQGRVCYQTYDATSSGFSASDIDVVTTKELVRDFCSFDIDITFMIKVAYIDAPLHRGPLDETVEFELLYATDGHYTCAIYRYLFGGMNFKVARVFIGVLADGIADGLEDGGNPAFYVRADVAVNFGSMQGATAVNLTPARARKIDPECACKLWHRRELTHLIEYRNRLNRMPVCPCWWWLAFMDRRFRVVAYDFISRELVFAVRGSTLYFPSGRTCFYSLRLRRRRWRPFGFIERGFFEKYNRLTHPRENLAEDRIYESICCAQARRCDLFNEVRPIIRGCSSRLPFFFARGRGDPHISTIDQRSYTMNGHGEYILAKAVDDAFQIQARTDKAVLDNATGALSDATIFSAFAIQVPEAWVQVEFNSERTDVRVHVGSDNQNGEDVTQSFREEGFFLDVSGGTTVERVNKTAVIMCNDAGVAFNVTVGSGVLLMTIGLDQMYQNRVEGLLGNFNGDPTDDFRSRQGETVSNSESERTIFENFAQTWMTDADESIFKYHSQTGHADYRFREFKPRFFDEFSAAEKQTGINQCGADKTQCIYDFVLTNSVDLAKETAADIEQAAEIEAEIANEKPTLSVISGTTLIGDEHYLFVNINENKIVTFLGEDDGTLTYEFYETSAKATLGTPAADGSVTVDIVVENSDPVSFSMVAIDDKEEETPVIDIVIVLCTGCSSHGACNNDIREDDKATSLFKYNTCECEEYWEGDDCEEDIDGCEGSPCGLDRECIDTDADAHKATPSLKSYTCSPCPDGYEDIDDKCEDIDECKTGTPCPQVCQNTEGSYICQCNEGFRLDEDGITCNDINECEESTHNCEQICNNIPASFTCSCFQGFTFNTGTSKCEQDVVPPSGCDALDCSNADGCKLDEESNAAACFCKIGYELEPDNTCSNINECLTNVCAQTCQDSVGSYTCGCWAGYQLQNDRITCSPCDYPRYGENCAETCIIGRGFRQCDPTKGILCHDGWTGMSCDIDINECQDSTVCGDINKNCTNTDGSYECICREGYQIDTDSDVCVDINECDDPDNPRLNVCDQNCQNTVGSFSCSCNAGFRNDPNDITKCVVINECAERIAGCEQICTENVGVVGFSCDCYRGYILNNDLKTCSLSTDPCARFPDNGCSQICKTVGNTFECECRTGFVLAEDGQTCVDLNECDPNLTLNRCSQPETCVNLNGGYSCSCSEGFKLENDQRTCRQCDSAHFGLNCANECACGAGSISCDHVTGCVCMPGYTDDKCSIDRNECDDFPCTGNNEICTNLPGNYSCDCESGYSRDQNDVCQEKDECANDFDNGCSQICENTPGSYQCSCNPGFLRDGNACNDINECAGQNNCTQHCENTLGGYRCRCDPGYKLDLTDRRTCIPEEQCQAVNICEDNTECAVLDNVEICTCLTGYQFVSGSTVKCEDIKECSRNPSPCVQVCTEQPGGYECSCDQAGYMLASDQTTCVTCPDGRFGVGCEQTCQCESSNTVECDKADGTCTCKTGWRGTACEVNINECLDAAVHNCTENSICADNLGSFFCQCGAGYLKAADQHCQACVAGKFGVDCAIDCTCVKANTQTCNNVDGSCACKAGWEGADCSVNIDECQQDSSSCVGVPNSRCIDAQGSFNCECFVGFIKQLDGTCTVCESGTFGVDCENVCPCVASNTESCNAVNGVCTCKPGWESDDCSVNINECTSNLFTCPEHSACQDTRGSYVCNCNAGYVKTNDNICEDVDECTQNNGGCLQKCENLQGSFVCLCDIGYEGTGNDCTICVDSYGEQCANQCNCDPDTSEDCHHVTGCVCRSGYTGVNCTDIDECTIILNVCQANAFCTNTRGGHTCTCNPGFIEDEGVCQECSGNSYGTNCATNCNCVNSNTLNPQQSCDHVNGDCLCNPYWDGDRCENNIDECDRGTDNCTKPNEDCHDIDNGFNCSCRRGFVYDNDRNCIRDRRVVTTPRVPGNMRTVSILLTVNITLKVDLGVGLTYEIYHQEIQIQLVAWYSRRLVGIAFIIFIKDIRPGSLILDYDVIVPEAAVPDVAAANLDFATQQAPLPVFDDDGYVTDMSVGNTAVPVNEAPSDELLCQIYEASIDGCGTDSDCVVQENRPSCEPKDDDDFGLAFGLGFGIPMFLLCVAAFLAGVVYLRQRKRNYQHSKRLHRDDDDRSSSMFARQVPVRVVTSAPVGPMYGPPDLEPFEASEYSDYDTYPENAYRKREGQGSWNFMFGNLRSDEEYHIRRPNVDILRPRGRYDY